MTSRERVVTALKGGTPDRVPVWEYLFSLKLMQEVMGYRTELYDGSTIARMAATMGIDSIWAPVNGFCGIEDIPHAPGEVYFDEWGVQYKKNGWPIIAQTGTPVKTRDDWERYRIPDVDTPGRLKILKDAIEANENDLAVMAGFLGPFTMMSWYLMDFETLSVSMFVDPGLVHEMVNGFVDWALKAADLAWTNGGIDAFHISDDWGATNGLLISPEQFREFFLEPFRRMVTGMKSYGVPVIMHNDGNLWEMLDELVNTGISAYHPVEKAAGMDLVTVKNKYSGMICPIGNVNNKTTMVTGTAAEVISETLECLRTGAPGGGYILSTDHSLHDDIPLENAMALIETVTKYGTYPLNLP